MRKLKPSEGAVGGSVLFVVSTGVLVLTNEFLALGGMAIGGMLAAESLRRMAGTRT